MSMKSNIFDSFLLLVSFNFLTQKRGIWKHKLAFSVQHPRMIPKRWCLLWTRHFHPVSKVRPRSGLHLLQRTRDIWHTLWITLVDLGVNWVWYFIELFGGPQMQILGGSIIRWTFSCDFTFISVIQVLPDSGHTGEGSWVNVNLLDNPSWPSNPGGMKLNTPRYLTFLP